MIYINEINKNDKKNKVIMIGRGKSVNNLDLKALNKQTEYDICTIADAMKIIDKPKYAFHYHYRSFLRSYDTLKKSEYILVNSKCKNDTIEKKIFEIHKEKIEDYSNIVVFGSKHIKLHQIINQEFDILVDKILYNYCGSVVGVVNFLLGYMCYSEVYYIGFDGGLIYGDSDYGDLVGNSRKETKIKGSMNKYFESWKGVIEMIKFYPNQKFLPLKNY